MSTGFASRARSWVRAATLALVVAFVTAGATVTPAQAAELPVVVSNPTLTQSDGNPFPDPAGITVGTWVRFGATWSIDGPIVDGDTLTVVFPVGFEPISSADFPLIGAGGSTLATCSYLPGASPAQIECTFQGGPYDGADGDIWFVAGATQEMVDETVTWTIGGSVVVVPNVTVGPVPNLQVPTNLKSGGVRIEGDLAVGFWDVNLIPNAAVTSYTITDVLNSTAPNRPHEFFGSESLTRFPLINGTEYDPTAGELIYSSGSVPGLVYSGTPLTTLNVTLTGLEPGYYYRFSYQTRSIGATAIAGDTFQNGATVNGVETSVIAAAVAFGGGGGNPGQYVSFSITKDLQDASGLVDVSTFALTASNGTQTNLINVPADGTTVLSPYFAAGSTITLCEQLPVIPGVEWESPIVFGDGVIGPDADGCYAINPVGGSLTALTLTNVASPKPFNLVLTKSLVSTGAVYLGDIVEFALTPSNEGPAAAVAGWSVTDLLPVGLTLVSMTGDEYTCDLPTATCTSALPLAAGESGPVITVRARVATAGTLHNVAYIAPSALQPAETNPLDTPTTSTDTGETSTDNDAQADVAALPAPIVPTPPQATTPQAALPATGGSAPIAMIGVAIALLLAGAILRHRPQRHGRRWLQGAPQRTRSVR